MLVPQNNKVEAYIQWCDDMVQRVMSKHNIVSETETVLSTDDKKEGDDHAN